jgi:glycylpeptide N-tetradecanoyltransferase
MRDQDHVMLNYRDINGSEVNFLCVHKSLRDQRLAPVLIKEVTRRINLTGVWQAAYTIGKVVPTPISQARYYHRSLNAKKLVEIGFSGLPHRHTMVLFHCI